MSGIRDAVAKLPPVVPSNIKEIKAKLSEIVNQKAEETQNLPEIKELSAYLSRCWEAARDAKRDIQSQLHKSRLQRDSRYTDEQLQKIKNTGQPAVFMGITSVKCRAAEGMIRNILGEDIWDIDPTPIADVNPSVMSQISAEVIAATEANPEIMGDPNVQVEMFNTLHSQTLDAIQEKAKIANAKMKSKISDQLLESSWRKALDDATYNLVTYKAGFIKGPVARRVPTNTWEQDPATSKWKAVSKQTVQLYHYAPSPLDMYPSPSATSIDDGYQCEHHRLTRGDLFALIGVEGYDENSIRAALNEYSEGGLYDWMWEQDDKEDAEGRDASDSVTSPDPTIDAIEFWGSCSGKMLLDYGMTDDIIKDANEEYQINAWKIGKYVIKAVLNPYPMAKKPYRKTSFESAPGSYWGRGLPEIMEDIQAVCNSTVRALVDNQSACSGPQIIADISKLETDTNIEEMYPWKVWYFDSTTGSWSNNVKPLEFFNIDSHAAELMAIYEKFEMKASDYTGIPSYMYGSTNIQGSGRTSSGLAMLMNNANNGIKFVISHIDKDWIEPCITDQYNYNMVFDPDDSIKGDLRVSAHGATVLMQKEQLQLRVTEFMNMLSTNPIYIDIVGRLGIFRLMRESLKVLNLPYDYILPSEKEFNANDKDKQRLQQYDQFMQGMQQAMLATQQGQLPPDALLQMVMQFISSLMPQSQASPSLNQGGMNNQGTPANSPPEALPDGSQPGGESASYFRQS